MTLVIDASVAVKWFVPETDSDRAQLVHRESGVLRAPDHILLEVGNTVWKLARRHDWPGTPAEAVIGRLRQLLTLTSTIDLAEEAAVLSALLDHPIYDCTYIALSRRSGGPLITADRRLFRRAQRLRPALEPIWLADYQPTVH